MLQPTHDRKETEDKFSNEMETEENSLWLWSWIHEILVAKEDYVLHCSCKLSWSDEHMVHCFPHQVLEHLDVFAEEDVSAAAEALTDVSSITLNSLLFSSWDAWSLSHFCLADMQDLVRQNMPIRE